jgi:hypothetical protein
MPLVPRFREFKQPYGTVHWALTQAMALSLTAAAASVVQLRYLINAEKNPESVFLAVSRKVRSCKGTRVNASASLVSQPRDGKMLGCAQPYMPARSAQAAPCVFRTSHVSSGRYGTTRPTIIQQPTLGQPALASSKPLRLAPSCARLARRATGQAAQGPCAYYLLIFVACREISKTDTRVEQPKRWRTCLGAKAATS